MKTLIIEDVTVNALALELILGDRYKVKVFQTGEEGLEAVINAYENHDPFRIVFLDLTLPKMNGREVLHQIKIYEKSHQISENHRSKVILVSASLESDTILATVLEDGGDAFIMKPISHEKLTEALENLHLA